MPKTYTCDHCHGTFQTSAEWSDEKAEEEAKRNLGLRKSASAPKSEVAELCTPCYQEFLRWFRAQNN